MILTDTHQTIDALLGNIDILKERWGNDYDKIFWTPIQEYNSLGYAFNKVNHDINFHETGFSRLDKFNILFSHFSPLGYAIEALEMPLYASKVFPNANIDMCYFDSRGRISNKNAHYTFSVHDGKITRPKEDFLQKYDITVTKSDTLKRMAAQTPDVLKNAGFKVNINNMNYAPCKNLGEDYAFEFDEFFTTAGRKYTNQSLEVRNTPGFQKYNVISIIGTIIWWKGQLEWIEKVDPEIIKDYVVVLYGNISDQNYYRKIIEAANRKGINLLHTSYVNPRFVCDAMTFSKLTVMNPYVDLPDQPTLGPSRCYGESLSCNTLSLIGQTYDKPYIDRIGKTSFVPENWAPYTVEYDQNIQSSVNESLEKALSIDSKDLPWENLMTIEENCDVTLEKCLNIGGI